MNIRENLLCKLDQVREILRAAIPDSTLILLPQPGPGESASLMLTYPSGKTRTCHFSKENGFDLTASLIAEQMIGGLTGRSHTTSR